MNDTGGLSPRGWFCNQAQSRFSNSYISGSTVGTAAQQTKSKGSPSYKSDAAQNPAGMSWDASSGNPLNTINYVQNFRWGNAIQSKWANGITRPDTYEASQFYEGE